MSQWSVVDWGLFFASAGTFVTILAAQLERLIRALHENSVATVGSSTALVDLKPAVVANTVAAAANTVSADANTAMAMSDNPPVVVNVANSPAPAPKPAKP